MITWFSRKKKQVTHHRAKRGSDDFVSLSSHELRSPLSVIKWYTEILLDEDAGKLTDDQRKYLTLIDSSNQRAIDLIRALLNVSRLDLDTFSVSPEEVSLNDIVSEVISSFVCITDARSISFDFVQEVNSHKMMLDKNLTTIIIKSLLANALLFSHDSSTIVIRFSHFRAGSTFLGVTLLDESIAVIVTDTGIGIPSLDQEKIATKMFRAGNIGDVPGSGLSLYIVKTIMEKVLGRFGFISEEGKGSTFFVAFPFRGMNKKSGRTTLE
jgi:signal transduction histidine kinase